MATYRFDYQNASDVEALNQTVAVTMDEIKAFIDQLFDNFNVDTCSTEHLNIIANVLGYPIDKEDDPDFIRKSLKNAISLYKSKGTAECIKVLFYNLGFYVDVVPLWTPDFVENVRIYPPYLKVDPAAYAIGFYDVTVINPDEQFTTAPGAIQII